MEQLLLFGENIQNKTDLQISRSGTFTDNMSLPIHRWFRYSAGFSADWVEQVISDWNLSSDSTILDPFSGSGTVSIVCDKLGINSIGIEAHPVVARISKVKLLWNEDIDAFSEHVKKIYIDAEKVKTNLANFPLIIQRSYDQSYLEILDKMKNAWIINDDGSASSELTWLAITSILRTTAFAGTAQWQYILPGKIKKKTANPYFAFQQQVETMKTDMRWMQRRVEESKARIIKSDAREYHEDLENSVHGVITSPPYANNYDYADALRFEMSFWGEINGWGELHEKVRKYLMVSSSQHSSKEKYILEELVNDPIIYQIKDSLSIVVNKLAVVREEHGGKKHYHTMIAAYCRDIGLVLNQLRKFSKNGSIMSWVIGDSAPYGVYCPIDEWIGELALAAGFKNYRFEKLRDRNIKWKNRKHRVPLKEGILWIEG